MGSLIVVVAGGGRAKNTRARKALSKLLKGARAEKTESMLYYEVRSPELLGVRKNDSK